MVNSPEDLIVHHKNNKRSTLWEVRILPLPPPQKKKKDWKERSHTLLPFLLPPGLPRLRGWIKTFDSYPLPKNICVPNGSTTVVGLTLNLIMWLLRLHVRVAEGCEVMRGWPRGRKVSIVGGQSIFWAKVVAVFPHPWNAGKDNTCGIGPRRRRRAYLHPRMGP
ncbi:hypothetical protein CDAR_199271 [Caerostris darwini]|uniref:Uncharacterized protein n=1 Tax=Caerostris darwini TaxID=1538125 RepID=A0AAV4QFH8_9ARAC|nr:hypothetical protein CDAR_199271 [Caerostris darwini]